MNFREELESDFDVDTGLAVGGKKKRDTGNNRKRFILDSGWANFLGIGKDSLELLDSSEVSISGINLKDINTQLQREGNGDLTVITTAAFNNRLEDLEDRDEVEEGGYTEYLLDSGLKIVNPEPLPTVAKEKPMQYSIFEDLDATLPFVSMTDYVGREQELWEDLQQYTDTTLVMKPGDSHGGKNVAFYRPKDLYQDILDQGVPEGWVAQVAVPAKGDARIIAAGDEIATGMVRKGEKDIHNLDQIGAESFGEKARKARRDGYAEPIDVETIDTAYGNILEDYFERVKEETDIDGNAELWAGWDFLVVDPEDSRLSKYPEQMKDEMFDEDYRLESGEYLVYGEINISPGSIVDYVNCDRPWQNSAANLVEAGESLSRGENYSRLDETRLDGEKEARIRGHFGKE